MDHHSYLLILVYPLIIYYYSCLRWLQAAVVSSLSRLLPGPPAPRPAHGVVHPATGPHPQCNHRTEEAGGRPSGGRHQVGVSEGERS